MRSRICNPLRLILIPLLVALVVGACFWILDYVRRPRPGPQLADAWRLSMSGAAMDPNPPHLVPNAKKLGVLQPESIRQWGCICSRMPLTRVAVSPTGARESASPFNASRPVGIFLVAQHHGIPPGRAIRGSLQGGRHFSLLEVVSRSSYSGPTLIPDRSLPS